MKYLITESQLAQLIFESELKQTTKRLLTELFSQKLVDQLIARFKEEDPEIDDELLKHYIDRFQEIKNSPKVKEKDITKYSWEQLKQLVDVNQPEDIKIEGEDELIYNKNNLKIYHINSKRACVKYGTGYNFCISSRGHDNQYYDYRLGKTPENRTPSSIYFVIDEDKSKKPAERIGFSDPNHLLVIMVSKEKPYYKKIRPEDPREGEETTIYRVTDANNTGQESFDSFDKVVQKFQPKLNGLENLFKITEPNTKEIDYVNMQGSYEDELRKHYWEYKEGRKKVEFDPSKGIISFTHIITKFKEDYKMVDNYLNGKPNFVYSVPTDDGIIFETKPNPNAKQEVINHFVDTLDYSPIEDSEIEVKAVIQKDPNYLEYLKKVRNTYMEYLHEKNKLNIPINENHDYRGEHSAPGPDSDDSPMHDLTNTFGDDIYGPHALRMFGYFQDYDRFAINIIQAAHNKPNMKVKIYRSVPKVITNQEKIDDYIKQKKYILKTGKLPKGVDNWPNSSEYYDWIDDEIKNLQNNPKEEEKVKINPGDWVTINFQYAKEHGQGNLGNKFRILSKTVYAKDLYNNGDSINEWGYFPSK